MKKRSSKPKETVLQIKFANEAAAAHFALWLCEGGEQDYWDWMEYREREEEGDITAIELIIMVKKIKLKTNQIRNDMVSLCAII